MSTRSESIYGIECLCGHFLESEARTLVCPYCRRSIVIEWPAREEPEAPLLLESSVAVAV